MQYLSFYSSEKISELEESTEFLDNLKQRQKKLIGQGQIGRNGVDNDYINTIITVGGELYELENGDGNITSFLQEISKIQTPEEYFREGRKKYGYTSLQILGRLKLPHIVPLISAINTELTSLKKLATDIEQEQKLSEKNKQLIVDIYERLKKLIREVGNDSATIQEVKQEVFHLLGNFNLPTFSCRDNGILGYQLKEIFRGINYAAWTKGDIKIIQTDSLKGVLNFCGIPDNYLQDYQDIDSWYGVFLHVLENGFSNQAEGFLIHYNKDLFFRIVREIIDGEERFTAIFSMQD